MYPLLSLHNCRELTRFCPHCGSTRYKRNGSYYRQGDAQRIPRYLCQSCKKSFSRSGYSLQYRHRHRRLHEFIRILFANGVTIRGIGRTLKIDKDTVARRLVLLGKEARHREQQRLASAPQAGTVQMDDLISFEHSKMKPLSVTVISDADRWRILGVAVSVLPASGLLAAKSRAKYGRRPDKSVRARHVLLKQTALAIKPESVVITDQHKDYPALIKRQLPQAKHVTHRSKAAAVVGQGELKKTGHDPLFCINHQLAMFRANVSRLFRRSWNTTKKIDRLNDHLCIFIDEYNRFRQPKSGREFVAKFDKP